MLQHFSDLEIETVDEIISSVEAVLRVYTVDNKDGTFRWQQDISDTDVLEIDRIRATYTLKFVQSISVLGFKIAFKNSIRLTLKAVRHQRLIATWIVDSPSCKSLCRKIIQETELAIHETLAEYQREILFKPWYQF